MATPQQIFVDIDLHQNQLLNPSLQRVSVFPTNPVKSQICYLIADFGAYKGNLPYYYNGFDWIPFNSSQSSGNSGVSCEFSLPETVINTSEYFYSWNKSSDILTSVRSGSTTGLVNDNISPIIAPITGHIVKAYLRLVGAGVQASSVVYPCFFQTEVHIMGISSEGTSTRLDIPIPNTYSIASYYPTPINAKIEVLGLNIPITKGDAIALKFIPDSISHSISSSISQIKNAFVTLTIE